MASHDVLMPRHLDWKYLGSAFSWYKGSFPGLLTLPSNVQTSWSNKFTFNSDVLDCVWNVMSHAQKPDFVFRRNGRVHLNRRGRQFSRLLAVEVCRSAVLMLETPCSEVVWRVLATHSISQYPLHFPSCASPCAITFKMQSTKTRK